jgi:predicted nucleotidyltransferase
MWSLIKMQERKIAVLCQRYAVQELAVFGSVLRSEFRA